VTRAGMRILLGGTALAAAAYVGAAALTAENALHPARRAAAPECPCVAHVHCGGAGTAAADGTRLNGWFYEPDQPNGAAVLLLHGVGWNREQLLGYGAALEKAGYRVLLPDLRGHGTSGGFTTYGVLEEQDVQAWADWMLTRPGVRSIYGVGVSLGASVLLEGLNREKRFRAVVAEAPYSSFPEIAVERTKRPLPEFVRFLVPPFVGTALAWGRVRYGADLRKASALEAVRRTRTPVLLIHGMSDRGTDASNSVRLAAANPAVTSLWLVPGAGHANVRETARAEYDERMTAWLAAH